MIFPSPPRGSVHSQQAQQEDPFYRGAQLNAPRWRLLGKQNKHATYSLHTCCNYYPRHANFSQPEVLTAQALCLPLTLSTPKHAPSGVLTPAPPASLPTSTVEQLLEVLAPLGGLGIRRQPFLLGLSMCSTSRAVYLLIASLANTHNNQLRHCQRITHSRPARAEAPAVVGGWRGCGRKMCNGATDRQTDSSSTWKPGR